MTRSFGLIFLLISLAVGGYLFAQQSKTDGPASTAALQAETQAAVGAAGTNFEAAQPELQAWFADHSTYAGVTLPPAFGVTVVRADATSYCLQDPTGTTHETGPGGSPAPGPC
jgi:hypothetical protein